MFGALNSLQDAIVDKLRLSPFLSKFRILKEECLNANALSIVGNTTTVVVKIPFPQSTSSANGNFNFSKIAIGVEINSPRLTAGNLYSPLSVAEYISKILNSWQAQTTFGASQLSINSQSPWQEYVVEDQIFSITLNFTSQSIA